MTERPLILISNDDGFQAKGINSLVDMLSDMADIIVCAPDSARSGFSCAFSATTPLRLTLQEKREGVEIWSCNGTPTDCVKMALANICQRQPQMVIGGINHGDNASVNAHYSGTMGVTLEGCMKFIPSVAYSLCDNHDDADFEPLRPYVRIFTCRMALGSWYSETIQCHHPRGYDYWWMVGHYRNEEPEQQDTDRWALDNGYVAITPTQIDVTAYEFLKQKEDWEQ